jgi:hypothetical protein
MSLPQLLVTESEARAVLAKVATRREELISEQLSRGEQRLCVICQVISNFQPQFTEEVTIFFVELRGFF